MACYTFKLGNLEFSVSSSNLEGETQLQNFMRAIKELKASDEIAYNKFILLLESLYDDSISIKPDTRLNRDIPYRIQANLKQYGIEMEVLNEEDWDSFCEELNKEKIVGIDKNAKAIFLDGKIYVKNTGFSVGDSLHELTHLILAVMKSNNFSSYLNFIHTMYQHPEVQIIARNIRSFGRYSDNYNLDFEEEAVVRYIEGIFTGDQNFIEEFLINDAVIDTLLFINDSLKDPIIATFGIKEFPGITTLFKSLLSEIPIYGSEMFIHRDISSTGYKEMKKGAIQAEGISALINYYSSEEGGNRIIKGECI